MPGPQEWMVIAIVALLVVGPDRLPAFSRQAARLLVRVRTEARRNIEELRNVAEVRELESDLREVTRSSRGARDEMSRSVRSLIDEGRSGPAAGSGAAERDRDRSAPADPEAT